MPSDGVDYKIPITNGAIIGRDRGYYGIKIEQVDKEAIEYKTDTPISAIGSYDTFLTIYEDGKKVPSLLTMEGHLLNPYGEEKEDLFVVNGEVLKKSKKDLSIIIEESFFDSYIICGEKRRPLFLPLSWGDEIGEDIYGFKIYIEGNYDDSSTMYPTQAPISGIEVHNHTIRIFEKDKSIPWTFTKSGVLIEEAEYNKMFESEQASYCKRHNITKEELDKEITSLYQKKLS